MRVMLIGDVGAEDGLFHAGDEAMLETALDELRARGIDSTIVSADPAHSTAQYGVPAVGRADFGAERTPNRAAREARLAAILAALTGRDAVLDHQDPAIRLIDTVAASDGVVIAGGGNLSSLWPEHVYERAAIVAIASAFEKPIVVSGQTLGPALTGRDGELLAGILTSAALVGVRERPSFEIAARLGVATGALRRTVDDATLLGEAENPLASAAPYAVATFAPYSVVEPEQYDELVAALLDDIAERTDLDVVFVPHAASLTDDLAEDSLKHASILSRMRSGRGRALGLLSAKQIAAVTRGARLSVSSRYHPVVFALSAGVPAAALTLDDYTGVKVNGAYDNLGLGRPAVPSVGLASGTAATAFAQIWERRAELAAHLQTVMPAVRAHASQWWDDVARVLAGETVRPAPELDFGTFDVYDAGLAEQVRRLDRWQTSERGSVTNLRIAGDERSEATAMELERALELEREVGALTAEVVTLETRLADAEHALDAAREVAAQVAEPLFARKLGKERVPHPDTALDALLNSRTFRWSRGPRNVYGRVRKVTLRVLGRR